MEEFQSVFSRYELKYMLTDAQYRALREIAAQEMEQDRFYRSTICNLYYDTPDDRLIRTSLEKPVYKEKLRLRCYRVPEGDSAAFLEIKKKYDGIVYKRRAAMPYARAVSYLGGHAERPEGQIFDEMDYFLRQYQSLLPAMFIGCKRISLRGSADAGLRMTFDREIVWRDEHLDLREGFWGEPLLREGQCLLEIKLPQAMPLWLSHALSALQIYPCGFSKYGAAYQMRLKRGGKRRELSYA